MEKRHLIYRVIKVIRSCQTLDQLGLAGIYGILAVKRLKCYPQYAIRLLTVFYTLIKDQEKRINDLAG